MPDQASPPPTQLNVVLCWHMHQPFYREGLEGEFRLPWVYLHGLKDYTDMAAHLEQHPNLRAVVDFSPVLLEQISIYVNQLESWLESGTLMSDPLLNLLAGARDIPAEKEARRQLVADCQRCNQSNMVKPYPAFYRLLNWGGNDALDDSDAEGGRLPLAYLSDAYFVDLLVWYHLAWMGHSLKQEQTITRLLKKESAYTLDDRCELIKVIHSSLAGIIPRYRALAEHGQIELAMTPYAHPIVPLLNDFSNMHFALPEAPAPDAHCYPGGTDRSRWHMQHGIELFKQFFGFQPQGVWLSEGGVSADALAVLEKYNIRWTASGEGVWKNCQPHHTHALDGEALRRSLFRPHQYQDNATRLFFRDDGLSDSIGFEYQFWAAKDAAGHFCQNLDNIARFLGDEADQHVVSIILDGENAWEHYPDNGHNFLDAFYTELAKDPNIRLTTFSEMSDQLTPLICEQICPGSWIYGSFSTWIGDPDKNRAWEALVAAKLVYDDVMASATLSEEARARAAKQLAICESSDWFWWFGDYNPADSVRDFDQMYRNHLLSLYHLLQRTPPESLAIPFSAGNQRTTAAGAMRRTS